MTENGDGLEAGEPLFDAEEVHMRVAQNAAAVRREVEETTGESSTLLRERFNNFAHPLAEAVNAEQDYHSVYSSANAYLTVVDKFVLPLLHLHRKERLLPLCQELEEFLREFQRRLAPLMKDQEVLVQGINMSTRQLASRLDLILRCFQGSDADPQLPSPRASLVHISEDLRKINATLAESMTLLVGPFSSTTGNVPTAGNAAGSVPTRHRRV